MKLVTRLRLFGIFATCLVIILGLTSYWRFAQVDSAIERNNISSDIVKNAFILTILNNDYLRTHGERAKVQWVSQYTHLNNQIASYKVVSHDEQQLIDQLRHEQETIFFHFSQLQTINKAAQERLNGQLSIDMQTLVSFTSALADINNQRLTVIRQTTGEFIFVIITILGMSFIVSYFLFARSLSWSIKQLIEGTKVLAKGDLSFRFVNKSHDEFGQLASSFNEMAGQLQGLDQAKDEFLALASHELRTPMTAIKGLVSMIMQGDYGPLPKKMDKPFTNISTSTDRQIHLINDLLNVSRLQTGKVEFTLTTFSIEQVMKEIIESLQPIARQKGIKLTVANAPTVAIHADSNWVKQVLNNLIGNALKFTDKGKVSLSYNVESDRVLIIVKDTGMGVGKEDQKKLFRKFQQLSTDISGKPTGSGLGLYISREIARKMGGDVWVEKSDSGQGSVFIFSIPKA